MKNQILVAVLVDQKYLHQLASGSWVYGEDALSLSSKFVYPLNNVVFQAGGIDGDRQDDITVRASVGDAMPPAGISRPVDINISNPDRG